MIGRAGHWTQTPSTCLLKPKKWNAHFWITFTFWWSTGLVDGLEPHLPPLSRHKIKCSFLHYVQLLMIGQAGWKAPTPSATSFQPKNEMLIFVLRYSSDDQPCWSMDSKPIHHPSSQKNEMLIFVLRSTSDDRRGWMMDSNCIHYPSPAKKMICSFLYYIQVLIISWAGQWTWTPSATSLQPKKWNAHFWITFNFWWLAGLVNGLKPHLPPLSRHKIKCSFLHYVQLLMIGQAGWKAPTPSATTFQPKNEMLIFVLRYSSDDQPCWSMDSKPIHHPSSQKNEMLIFVLCSTSDDRRGWLMDSNCIHYPSPAKKMKCSFLYYIQLLMIGRAGHWTWTPSPSCLKPKKMKCSFLDYV